ncbi:MAG: hypothetical protein ACM3ML_17445 [Micromonosporaceae bacterium]
MHVIQARDGELLHRATPPQPPRSQETGGNYSTLATCTPVTISSNPPTPDGEPGLHYLCPSYKAFFGHIRPAMNAMCELLRAGHAIRTGPPVCGRGRETWP